MKIVKNNFALSSEYWRKMKENRCVGAGADYRPWYFVHEVPSRGRSTRTKGFTTNRVHHMLSDLETNFYYWLEWRDDVTDIREQYMLDFTDTVSIARELNIVHPRKPKTKELHIMTTDFLVNFEEREVAYSCKYKKDLDNKRTEQKLRIEATYWEKKGIKFAIITEEDLPWILIKNIRRIHKATDLTGLISVPPEQTRQFILKTSKTLLRDGWTPVELADEIDRTMGFGVGTCMFLLYHFLATRQLQIDLSKPIDVDQPWEVQNNDASDNN